MVDRKFLPTNLPNEKRTLATPLVSANEGEDEIFGALGKHRQDYGGYWEHGPGQRLGSGMILLDTHILIELLVAPENLSPKAKKAIRAARKSGPLALSAISLWEIAWLAENKKIDIDVSVDSFVKKCASYVQVLPVTQEVAVRSVQFPKSHPNDPQPRIIGATALVEGIGLLTHTNGSSRPVWFPWHSSTEYQGRIPAGSISYVESRLNSSTISGGESSPARRPNPYKEGCGAEILGITKQLMLDRPLPCPTEGCYDSAGFT
jgi:PIN domain nuclease of toxin-antitoxin system